VPYREQMSKTNISLGTATKPIMLTWVSTGLAWKLLPMML